MHIGKRIKQLIESTNIPDYKIAEAIGKKDRQSLYYYYSKQHVSTEVLERLSKLFKVPIKYFFDENFEISTVNESIEKEWLLEKIRLLEENKALLEEKLKNCSAGIDSIKTKQQL